MVSIKPPVSRPCDSLDAQLWREFARECIARGDDMATAARNADALVKAFLERYPAKGGV